MQKEQNDEVIGNESINAEEAVSSFTTVTEPIEITYEYVERYLKENTFDLLPSQKGISHPMIVRYVKMLRDGNTPPPIKVDDSNAIVEGHHRYISGHIVGKLPPQINGCHRPNANYVRSWDSIPVDTLDWDKKYQ